MHAVVHLGEKDSNPTAEGRQLITLCTCVPAISSMQHSGGSTPRVMTRVRNVPGVRRLLIAEAMETSASFEARSAPLPYPTSR